MKKIVFSLAALFFLNTHKLNACASGPEPDQDYFNLFTQELINNPNYQPFLLTYDNPFFTGKTITPLRDENVESWQAYFNNEVTYEEADALVKTINAKHLQNWVSGKLTHQLTQKLGKNFFTKYREGLMYLLYAKELEPYMRINFADNGDYFYNAEERKKQQNATKLNFAKTVARLQTLYTNAKNPEIKLRYAYQLVRFYHYTRNYKKSVQVFTKFVTPLNLKSPIYYYALDQMAGAQRGLKMMKEANYNFFQVFMHSRNRKESAYNSMKISNDRDFSDLVNQAKTSEEKNMAYFLLAYSKFTNPIPIMEKMYANKADSEILKVLTARAINELERSFLPVNYYCYDEDCKKPKETRLPLFQKIYDTEGKNFAQQLSGFIQKNRENSKDVFWDLSEAYVQFLDKNYAESKALLNQINTNNPMELQEIEKMKMLNDIVSQTSITPQFEEEMMKKYSGVFLQEKKKNTPWDYHPTTTDFLRDILANRYFLQKEDGKSFLLNNQLSDLQYNPNSDLVQKVEEFYRKPNKTEFEKYIAKNFNDVGDADAFFQVIYGDQAMRNAQFEKAKSHYEKAKNFKGIPRILWDWDNEKAVFKSLTYNVNDYNGFVNIPSLIFGHNRWESFESKPEISMVKEDLSVFPFITQKMNKLELSNALIELEKIGKGTSELAVKANQLIGNVLYNTSVLGYFRHVFVMDINNENGPKFYFGDYTHTYHFYYKNFSQTPNIKPDNFDLAIQYYQKSFDQSKNAEQKARLLFQMASAEQGKYYQWEATKSSEAFQGIDDITKREEIVNGMKNQKFRTYFAQLKNNCAQTQTAKNLQSSCLYFGHYMKK